MSGSVPFSDNCDSYTDHASSMIYYSARGSDGKCVLDGTIFSCQDKQYERPDKSTVDTINRNLEMQIRSNPSCMGMAIDDLSMSFKPVIIGAKTTELSGEDIAKRHMASNCADSFDIGKINTHNHYSCKNYGTYEQDGKTVRNYDKVWDGILPSCEQSMELSEQTDEDIKKLVLHRAEKSGIVMKMEDLACNIFGSSV
jgi:hypothetical protein